jgi:hypothetical protein
MSRIMGEIVEPGDRAYPGGQSRMGRDVAHSLTVQEYGSAVAQTAHVIVPAPSHLDDLSPKAWEQSSSITRRGGRFTDKAPLDDATLI